MSEIGPFFIQYVHTYIYSHKSLKSVLPQTTHLLSEGVTLERITQIMKKEAGSLSPPSRGELLIRLTSIMMPIVPSFFFFWLVLFGGTLLLWCQMITSLLLSFTILALSILFENHSGVFLSLSRGHASECGFIEKLSNILAALYYIHYNPERFFFLSLDQRDGRPPHLSFLLQKLPPLSQYHQKS